MIRPSSRECHNVSQVVESVMGLSYNRIGNTTSRRRTRIVSYNRGRLCHDRAFGIAGQTVERTKQCSIAVRRRFPFWDISTGRSTYRHLDLLHHKAN